MKQYLYLSFGLFMFLIFIVSCGEHQKVKDTCQKYIDGRIALYNGDSSTLKEVLSDTMYTILMLHHKHTETIKLHSPDAFIGGPPVNGVYPSYVEIDNDKATCKMSGTYDFQYIINLSKINDKWIVVGENGIRNKAQIISETRNKISVLEEQIRQRPFRDSVLSSVQVFLAEVKNYFLYNGKSSVNSCNDKSTETLIKNLYRYTTQRNSTSFIKQEIGKPKYVTFDIERRGKSAVCQHYEGDCEINLTNKNDKYVVTGLNGLKSKEILLDKSYPKLLQTLRLIDITAFK